MTPYCVMTQLHVSLLLVLGCELNLKYTRFVPSAQYKECSHEAFLFWKCLFNFHLTWHEGWLYLLGDTV